MGGPPTGWLRNALNTKQIEKHMEKHQTDKAVKRPQSRSLKFRSMLHSQLLNIIILKVYSLVLLNLLGNISCIAQVSKQYGESTIPVLISQEGQCLICKGHPPSTDMRYGE